jgi:hypothetical protein
MDAKEKKRKTVGNIVFDENDKIYEKTNADVLYRYIL